MSNIDRFIARLQRVKSTATLNNPYRQVALRNNLRAYLHLLQAEFAPQLLLIGEAPGYRGCRLTGVPFSSGGLFERVQHPFLQQLGPQLQLNSRESENTATIVWNYLACKKITPVFWNAVPFHPHVENQAMSNRPPTLAEIDSGLVFLQQIEAIFRPARIVALGKKALKASQMAFPGVEIVALRHPSYGGKSAFVAGMDCLIAELELAASEAGG